MQKKIKIKSKDIKIDLRYKNLRLCSSLYIPPINMRGAFSLLSHDNSRARNDYNNTITPYSVLHSCCGSSR